MTGWIISAFLMGLIIGVLWSASLTADMLNEMLAERCAKTSVTFLR